MTLTGFSTLRLSGDWDVFRVPLDRRFHPATLVPTDALRVPECTHLQLVLYPDQPYWGDHLRTINDHAWVYCRTFVTPDGTFSRAQLRFEGVDYRAEVWLNGQWLGCHEGHFTPFSFDVTEALHEVGGENIVMVCVTAPWDAPNPKGTYPTDHVIRGMVKGLYEHGEGVIPPNVNPLGIWRPVWLRVDQGMILDHVRIRTDLEGNAALCFTITNATHRVWTGHLKLEIIGENHHGIGATERLTLNLAQGKHEVEHTLHIPNPQLWWTWDHGEPNLYRLSASLYDEHNNSLSRLDEVFGFRTIRLERTPERFTYFLNDRPIFIRGSSYLPGVYLSQCDQAMLSRDLALAKAANLNLLRVHIHVSPPELYTLCDRQGIMVWQDFELNWMHAASLEFEARACVLQHDMIDFLGNHPAIMTWCCHNEPTMIYTERHNLEDHPDPALYTAAMQQDPTRPVFLCSGQMDDDWERSGDTHSYYGAIWSDDYTDVYHFQSRLSTEFGFEAPACKETLQTYSFCWERLQHLDGQIEAIGAYQAALIQYHIEHFRRLRAASCAGYVHFWLIDLVPQVGCGVLDAYRLPKAGYAALQSASQPLHIALEHDGKQPYALWVFNDTPQAFPQCVVCWRVSTADHTLLLEAQTVYDVAANASQQVTPIHWQINPQDCAEIELTLSDNQGNRLAINRYHQPFQPRHRPKGYPWKFDFELGTKVFDRADASSLVALSGNKAINLIPLQTREKLAEWALRQHLPHRLVSVIARFLDLVG